MLEPVFCQGLLRGYAVVQYTAGSTSYLHCAFVSSWWTPWWFSRWSTEDVEIAGFGCGKEEESPRAEIKWKHSCGSTYGESHARLIQIQGVKGWIFITRISPTKAKRLKPP
jgi:hypothetical protein